MKHDPEQKNFLPGYAWAIRVAHEDFIVAGYFDNGSMFHCKEHMYSSTWSPEGHSVLVHTSQGTMASSASRREHNLRAEIRATLYTWPSGKTERFAHTNEALLLLLKGGDVAVFRKSALSLDEAVDA